MTPLAAVGRAVSLTVDSLGGGTADLAKQSFALEGSEDNETELDFQGARVSMSSHEAGSDPRKPKGGWCFFSYLPLTFTKPVPWPMRPSEAQRRSYMQMQRPIFWMTRLEYLALRLSSMATLLCFSNCAGAICTRSEIFVCNAVSVPFR